MIKKKSNRMFCLTAALPLFSVLVLGWMGVGVRGQEDIGIGCGWAEGVESISSDDEEKIALWRRLVAAEAGVIIDENVPWDDASITRREGAEAERQVGRGNALSHIKDAQCAADDRALLEEEEDQQRRLGSCGCNTAACNAGIYCFCGCPCGTCRRRQRNLSSSSSPSLRRRLTERELESVKRFATRTCIELDISCFDCDAPYVSIHGTVRAEPAAEWKRDEWERVDHEVEELGGRQSSLSISP